MSIKESRAEQVWGIVFMVFSLVLAFVLVPTQVKITTTQWYNSPRLFPYVLAGLMFGLGMLLTIGGFHKAKKGLAKQEKGQTDEQETYPVSVKETVLVLITLAVVALYIVAMYFLPYIPCTIVALGALMWLYGQRSWLKLISISVAFPLLVYFAFTVILKLRMP